MSASVVPPPPPPEAPPPLPDEPPPPVTPTQATDGVPQYVDMQHVYQHSGGNAAYPYAQQPMYQYPLQQPYTQAYNPYPSYPSYNAWSAPAVHSNYGVAANYSPYQPTQQYQSYSTAQPGPPMWGTSAVNTSTTSGPHPGAHPGISGGGPGTGIISFSLDGTSRAGAAAEPQASRSLAVPAQRPLAIAAAVANPPQNPASTAPATQGDKAQALKDWIKRALQKYDSHESERLRETMKRILEEKREQGALYTHDWDREPLPMLPPLPAPPPQQIASQMHAWRESPVREIYKKGGTARQSDRGPPLSESSIVVGKRKKKLNKQIRDRTSRFAQMHEGSAPGIPEPVWNPDIIIQGTCQSIEKSFLRLNGVPKPEEVRPEPVLVQALDRIVNLIAGGEKDFMYIWSQLKAIRQDLTVQHIRNETTVRTEEVFARAALEHSDQQEFRKCVGTLQAMYDEGLPGSKAEFGGYQLLLYICIEQKDRALSFSRAVLQLVTQGVWDTAEVQHAMSVYQAITSCNYVRFWNLYFVAPNCGQLVMDWGVRRLRFDAVQGLVMSYRTVPLGLCMRRLGFSHDTEISCSLDSRPLPGASVVHCAGVEGGVGDKVERGKQCVRCLHAHGGLTNSASDGKVVFLAKESAGKIVVPKQEQTSARAVGNTHLDCTAFLKEFPADRSGTRVL